MSAECPNCGAPRRGGDLFCGRCGRHYPKRVPGIQRAVGSGSRASGAVLGALALLVAGGVWLAAARLLAAPSSGPPWISDPAPPPRPTTSEGLRPLVLAELFDDELWGDLGDAYSSEGRVHLAESAWAVALTLDPDDSEWMGHGPVLTIAPMVVREIEVTDDEWIGDLADSLDARGWFVPAVELWDLALLHDPDDSEWLGKPGAWEPTQEVRDVITVLDEDLSQDEVWGNFGDALSAAGQPRLAEGAWAVALLLDPADFEWQSHSPAIESALLALRFLPVRNDGWLGGVGDAASDQGYSITAREIWRFALELDPEDPDWRERMGIS